MVLKSNLLKALECLAVDFNFVHLRQMADKEIQDACIQSNVVTDQPYTRKKYLETRHNMIMSKSAANGNK